jgi:hypothetical protein
MDKLLAALKNKESITINGQILTNDDMEDVKLKLNIYESATVGGTLTNIANNIMKGGSMDNSIYEQMQRGGFINSDYSELQLNNDTLSLTEFHQ